MLGGCIVVTALNLCLYLSLSHAQYVILLDILDSHCPVKISCQNKLFTNCALVLIFWQLTMLSCWQRLSFSFFFFPQDCNRTCVSLWYTNKKDDSDSIRYLLFKKQPLCMDSLQWQERDKIWEWDWSRVYCGQCKCHLYWHKCFSITLSFKSTPSPFWLDGRFWVLWFKPIHLKGSCHLSSF